MNASDYPGSICGRMLPWGLQGGPPSEPVSDDISILPNVLTPNQAIALLSAQSQRGTGRSWRSAVPPSLPYANSANQSQFDVLLSGNSGEDASGGVLAALDRARVLGGSTARAIGAMDDEELFQLGLAHGIMLGGLPRNECVDILIQHFARFHPQLLDGPPPSSLHAIGRMCVPISDSYQHVIEERYSTAPEDIDPEAFLDTPMHASHEFTFINPVRAAAMSSPGSHGGHIARLQRPPVLSSPLASSARTPMGHSNRVRPVLGGVGNSARDAVQSLSPAEQSFKLRQPPDVEAAKKHVNSVHPRLVDVRTGALVPYPIGKTRTGRHCFPKVWDVFHESNKSSFSDLGAGITLYFKFLKWGFGTFLTLSLVYLPLIVLNTFGHTASSSVAGFSLADTTLGHLGNLTQSPRLFIPSTRCGSQACSISKADAALVYGYIDVIASLVFLLAYLWLRAFERKEAASVDRLVLTIADYAIKVGNIPEDATVPEILTFFEQLTGCTVSEVSIARDNSELVALSIKRGRLVKRMEILDEYLLVAKEKGRESRLKTLREQRSKLVLRMKDIALAQRLIKAGTRAMFAFVTFEEPEGLSKALEAYPSSYMQFLLQPYRLRLRGTQRLVVNRAPDPSTILWEHLGASRCERFSRRVLTTSVTLALIALSFLLLWWASYEQKVTNDKGGEQSCNGTVFTAANVTAGVVHCYCDQLSSTNVFTDPLCKAWLSAKVTAIAITLVASSSVVVMNTVLSRIMRMLTKFEKHHSLDDEARSLSVRLFLTLFVNTGIVVLIANASFTFFKGSLGQRYSDFVPAWYQTVGSSILITMALNIGFGQAISVLRLVQALCARRYVKPINQRQMNDLLTGPEFVLSTRYAQVINTCFVTLAYCSALPLLAPLCAGYCFVSDWVDKILLCRFYRTPPIYNEKLGVQMSSLLPFALVLHLGFALWMLSTPEIFSTRDVSSAQLDEVTSVTGGVSKGDPNGRRIREQHVFPLFILLLFVIAMMIVIQVLRVASRVLKKSLNFLLCGFFLADVHEFDHEVQASLPTLSQAKERKYLRGLASFNILQNPRFKQAFGISAAFADGHNEVSEVLSSPVELTNRPDN